MIFPISRSLFFIERGWLNANHFVFDGRQKILIDTGYIACFAETRKWIEITGVDLRSIDWIVNTHSHCDHVGGNKKIQEISGCRIAMHRADKESIDRRDGWATWYRFYDQEAEFFPVDRALEEGEEIDLDGLVLRVIHTPGHARGGISLYAPQGKFLLSADALWDGDLGVLNTIVEGEDAPLLAMSSLEKIAALKVQTICPGHGGIIHNPQAAIHKCRQKLEEVLQDPRKLGKDHLKKILIWVLMMKKGYDQDRFFAYLMSTPWFKAVVDSFFEGRYFDLYREVMEEFLKRDTVFLKDGVYYTRVTP